MTRHICVVTGGAGSIGFASAQRLAQQGYAVALLDLESDRLQERAQLLRDLGVPAAGVAVDLTSEESITAALAQVTSELGIPDVLVTSAGGSARERTRAFVDQTTEVFDDILAVNLRSVLLCARALLPGMKRAGWGRIVNIASIVGIKGKQKLGEYAAAKAGIIALSMTLAMESASGGVTVNCVSPGLITRNPPSDEVPLTNYVGREGRADDIANAVMFFVSEDSDFVTGANLVVDGGRSLGLKGD